MDLNEIAAFAGVVRERSFSGAARTLGIPKSTLSERVARLEEQLGVRLVERTTRKVMTTPAGEAYFDRVVRVMAELDEASAAVAESHRALRGLIRIGCPTLFARRFLLSAIDDFMVDNPDVEFDLIAADRRFHLLEEGLDAAVTITNDLENVVTHRLAKTARLLVASPRYLARHGVPGRPSDLSAHRCLISTSTATTSRQAHWTFVDRAGETTTIPVRGRLVVSSVELAAQSALDGTGITVSPALLCQSDIDDGRLVHVLPRWSVGANDLLLIHGPTRELPVRVTRFLEFTMARFASTPAIDGLEKIVGASRPRRSASPLQR
jgi:DNA-binding transcriptional LysR family regulator